MNISAKSSRGCAAMCAASGRKAWAAALAIVRLNRGSLLRGTFHIDDLPALAGDLNLRAGGAIAEYDPTRDIRRQVGRRDDAAKVTRGQRLARGIRILASPW